MQSANQIKSVYLHTYTHTHSHTRRETDRKSKSKRDNFVAEPKCRYTRGTWSIVFFWGGNEIKEKCTHSTNKAQVHTRTQVRIREREKMDWPTVMYRRIRLKWKQQRDATFQIECTSTDEFCHIETFQMKLEGTAGIWIFWVHWIVIVNRHTFSLKHVVKCLNFLYLFGS